MLELNAKGSGITCLPATVDKVSYSLPNIRRAACIGRIAMRMIDVLRSAAVVGVSAVPEHYPKECPE